MATEIRIPTVDESTEEVQIVRWLKQKGQTVASGEALLEIQTDKATVEVESFADGVLLEVLVQQDDTVPVNTVVAIVGTEGEDVSELLNQR
ncbi:MAG: biotin/lipoyl-containing protein [Planctomycetota bacterium]|nr:biotin/lipoyl-containing protein [Planctomycetota bacterium]